MLTDNFKRKIDYLRISVTDRCDLRCTYCMAEDVTFLPRQEVLSIEEIIKLTDIFNELGVKKFRLTGGEPLVRKNVVSIIEHLHNLKISLTKPILKQLQKLIHWWFLTKSFFPSIIMEPFPYDFSILLITDLSLFKFSFLSI